jgi:hypothetical protein
VNDTIKKFILPLMFFEVVGTVVASEGTEIGVSVPDPVGPLKSGGSLAVTETEFITCEVGLSPLPGTPGKAKDTLFSCSVLGVILMAANFFVPGFDPATQCAQSLLSKELD